MKIALDAMGSDAGATPLVEGAVMAVNRFPCEVYMAGREHSLRRLLKHFRYRGDKIHILPCSEVVRMSDSPAESLQKKKSSISVAARFVAEGKADAMVSAGNTGSTLAHCMRNWKRIKGIKRPGIASLMPTHDLPCLLIDAGANVDCKPRNLVDFALMGSIYSSLVLERSSPRVGILSVGEERSKGNSLTLETYGLLEKSHLNFVGNVEPDDVFNCEVDVLVCDGFVGNVFLKVSEAVAHLLIKNVKGAMMKNVITIAGALMVSPGLRQIRRKVDNSEYGGAPLLGLEHICIIGHGAATPKSVMNMIRVAIDAVDKKITDRISNEVGVIAKELRLF
ncbi:MAG: phosphate acyltransferase PlsX [Candidatus Sumerlaeia bacterium]